MIGKGQEGILGGDGNVLALQCRGAYTSVYIAQNLLNCKLEMSAFKIKFFFNCCKINVT